MNVLFVMFFLPNLNNTNMYIDLVKEFKKNGHTVYPMGPLGSEYKKSGIYTESGIEVLRVETLDLFSKNLLIKGMANVLLSCQYKSVFFRFWKKIKVDLIIVPTPSVMFANFVSFLKKRFRVPVFLMQKDIFPQGAVDLGVMQKDSLIYNFFRKYECKLLSISDYIGCTSPANIKYLKEHNSFLDPRKLMLLYNCSKICKIQEFDKEELKKKYSINNRFTVIFGGNMGKPQQMENVILLAEKCMVHEDVKFLIVGNGTEVEKVRELVRQMNLNNIILESYIPRIDYLKVVSSCDLGLISLHQNFTIPNTPMKFNDYLIAGIPILASIDRSTDLGEILVNNNLGDYAYADDAEKLYEKFCSFYLDKKKRNICGENGWIYANNNLTVEKAYKDIISCISV